MADMLKQQISSRLKELRDSKGMTQEQVARNIGVTWRNYQRWEKGEVVPRNENIEALAETFGVQPTVILGQAATPKGTAPEQTIAKLYRELAVLQGTVHDLTAWKRDVDARLDKLVKS